MDLNQLSVFVRVVDKGSFTLAARYLQQPKSKVSRHLAALETELGTPLLYRSTRQLSLTEAGRELYEKVKDHIYGLEEVSTGSSINSEEATGLLKLTAAEDLGSILLGPFVYELSKINPLLKVNLHLSNDVVDLVKEGIDIALRIGEMDDTSLKAKRVGYVYSIFVASPQYLKKHSEPKQPIDLEKHSVLLFSPDSIGNQVVLLKEKKPVKIKLNPFCTANNPKTLLDIALLNGGVALIPEFLCLDAILQKKLVRVLPEFTTKLDPVHFVWPAQKGHNAKLRACLDFGVPYLAKYFS
jgi:DNA-binding transcriptional LysR family regulator